MDKQVHLMKLCVGAEKVEDLLAWQAQARAKGFRVGLSRVEDYFEGTNIKAYGGAHPGGKSNDDYCWGIAQALLDEGFVFPHGGDAVFRSTIPFRAGCSSSSAMLSISSAKLSPVGSSPSLK